MSELRNYLANKRVAVGAVRKKSMKRPLGPANSKQRCESIERTAPARFQSVITSW